MQLTVWGTETQTPSTSNKLLLQRNVMQLSHQKHPYVSETDLETLTDMEHECTVYTLFQCLGRRCTGNGDTG